MRMPLRRTTSGRRSSTIFRRFCTSTAARSGLVPCLNDRLIDTLPAASDDDDMYSSPGAPFISRSMMAVTADSTVRAEAPG